MRTGRARWLAPLGASVAVLAAVLVPSVALTRHGSGVGPGPDRTDVEPSRLALPSPRPGDRRDSTSRTQLQITSYEASGRVLTVFYRVAPRTDCSSDVQRPSVTETTDDVAVRLVRTPAGRPDSLCGFQRLESSVAIRLEQSVGGRLVRDSGRRGALVPLQRPFRSSS